MCLLLSNWNIEKAGLFSGWTVYDTVVMEEQGEGLSTMRLILDLSFLYVSISFSWSDILAFAASPAGSLLQTSKLLNQA